MIITSLTVLLRAALLVAITASTAMFVDYSSAEPAFCGLQSGCAAVRFSAFSHLGPIPLPAIGLGVFVGLFALATWAKHPKHYKFLATAAGLAAVGAVALIGIQIFVVKSICAWCMAVDVSAVVAAVAAMLIAKREPPEEVMPLRFVWGFLCIAAIAVPLMWEHKVPTATVPDGVAAHYVAGKINIVMFTDFECPYCRAMHPVIDDVKKQNPDKVNVVRLMMPLQMHPGAEPAALAYLCTPPAQRDAIADVLYGATGEALEPKGIAFMAKNLGLDYSAISKCMNGNEVREELEAQKKLFSAAALRGLPSTFVNDELVAGADEPHLAAAVSRALAGGDKGGADVTWMFAFLAVLLAAVASISFKAASAPTEPESGYA